GLRRGIRGHEGIGVRPRPARDRRHLALRLGRPLVAARAAAQRVRGRGLPAREDPRLRGGLRRGPVDDRGGDRGGRARAGDHGGALRTVRVAAGRVVRREGERGAPQPVRRPRGQGGREGAVTATAENPLLAGVRLRRRPDACILVIFGASGDLTSKKLMPALYALAVRHLLPEKFGIIGAARTSETDDEFRERMKQAVQEHARDPFDEEVWSGLADGMHYVTLDFADDKGEDELRE